MGTDAHKSRLRPLGIKVRGRPERDEIAPTPAEIEVERAVSRYPRGARAVVALALAVVSALLAPHVSAGSAGEPVGGPAGARGAEAELVRVVGGELRLGEAGFTPIGFNDYRLTSAPGGYVCDGDAGAISDAELDARLDRVQGAGGNVVRTWFFQSYVSGDGSEEEDYAAFDRVLDAASERGLRVIPVLANQWSDCEAGSPPKDLGFYAGGFRDPDGAHDRSYLQHATALAERYAGDPAIAYWQLVNEPEAPGPGGCAEGEAAAALAGFASAAAEAIRAVDPGRPISLGLSGGGQCGAQGEDYERVQADVDVCELHLYDTELTGTSPADPVPGDGEEGAAGRIAACEAAGKPIVAGEIGFAPDLDDAGGRTGEVSPRTLGNRARFLAHRVEALTALGLDGYQIWQLESDLPDPAAADPFGVPPCDPVEQVIRQLTEGAPQGPEADSCAGAGEGGRGSV